MSAIRGVIEQNRELALAQIWHASLIIVLPTSATVIAAIQLVTRGVVAWELALCAAMYFLTMVGTTVGFHRLLAHRSFVASRALLGVLAILGSMAAQGPPVYWASNHRRHHAYSDRAGDPHSPYRDGDRELRGIRGFFHAHIGWTFSHALTNPIVFSRDLLQESLLARINRSYYLWVFLGLLIPTVTGWALTGSWTGGLDGLVWGGGVRLFLTYHFTNCINSVTHLFGYRRFETHERSRNNPWLALPTLGESWHNNHHANPGAANFGHAWWEIDVGWGVVWVFGKLGWARDIGLTAGCGGNRPWQE